MGEMENKKLRESKIQRKWKRTEKNNVELQSINESFQHQASPQKKETALIVDLVVPAHLLSSSAHQCKQPDPWLPTPGILFRSLSDPALSPPLQLSISAVGSITPRSCVQAVRDRIWRLNTLASSLLWEDNFGKCVFHWLPQLIQHD